MKEKIKKYWRILIIFVFIIIVLFVRDWTFIALLLAITIWWICSSDNSSHQLKYELGNIGMTSERYQEIKEKWNKKEIKNLVEAIKIYPSKHLMNNNEEWEKTIEKQREYAAEKDAIYAHQLQKEYGLTEEGWKKLESHFFIEGAKELQKNPEFQKALERIKRNK